MVNFFDPPTLLEVFLGLLVLLLFRVLGKRSFRFWGSFLYFVMRSWGLELTEFRAYKGFRDDEGEGRR